ncbi:XrtA/PEP-CTERM system TPR-repeat protein PrsT [Alteromonas gracilis]|uniref:PEP-CTERM system TPR-repeat protein PrsT n=1 Tax=Alteromonas gracilis TaxID=1479524 RepID=A0ABX5CPZ5_9ALTE|nr:XrtA/PEP-CTERM system TPR-repeat protein PrsT [Alteromonas gracilis]PRO69490.1 PEP-CTERM system TPR-repeat protein PrsT [Alteromonas gracilis]
MTKHKTNKLIKRTTLAVMLTSALLSGCSEKSMESHLADARNYASQQQLDAAIVEYKNAIQKAPNAAEPRFELGKLYLQQNNFAAAEKELNKAMDLGHPVSQVIPLLSVAYQQSGAENALSELDYRAEGMTAVESAEVGFYKLQALMQLGKTEEAQALLADLSTLDTSSVYKGLIDSYVFVLNNDMEGALAATEALREQAPTNKDVLQQLAKIYLQNGEPEKAAEVYGVYVSQFPDDVTSKFAYAALLIEIRDLEKAAPIVNDLLTLNENHPLLNTFKGIIESANENYAKALEHLEIAVQNGRSDQVVRLVAGFSAYQIQDFEAAQRHLTMVASSLPDNHPGLRMLADSMLQLGENDEALEVLARVEGEQGIDAALFSKASYQLLKDGNVVGAKQMVEKSEAVSATAEDLSRLGVLQLSLNDIDGLVNLEEAVEKAPESVTSQATLLRAYIATNQLDKAKVAAKEWHEQSPETAAPLIYLGNIATAEGAYQEAAQYLDKASGLSDAGNEVTYSRANLLVAEGKKENAIAFIRAFIDENPADVQALALWFALAAEEGDGNAVIAHTQTQFNKNKSDLKLRLLLARMYSINGQLDNTVSLLADVEGDESSPQVFWNLKGQTLIATNNVKEATAFFDRWLSFYPQDKNAVLGKLLIVDSQKQFKQGLALTDKVLAKRPDAQLTLMKAYFHSRLGQAKPAWEIINSTTDDVKALPFVRGIIARLHLIEKAPEQAVEHAKAAYDATPNSDNALLLVAALEMSGKKEQAFSFLEKHVGAHNNDVQSAMLLAERQIRSDRKAAIDTYEQVLSKTPDNFVVLNNLAYLAFEDGELKRAEELAKKAVSLQRENADAVDTLAQIYIAKGDKEAALALYEQVSAGPIASDEVYLNHVDLLLALDKEALAKRRLASREFSSEAAKQRAENIKQQHGL